MSRFKCWKVQNLTRQTYIYLYPHEHGCGHELDKWNFHGSPVVLMLYRRWSPSDAVVVSVANGSTACWTVAGFSRTPAASDRVATYCPRMYRPKGRVEAVRWVDTPECREIMARWFEKHHDAFVTDGPVAIIQTGPEVGDHVRLDEGCWVVHNGDEWVTMTDDVFTACYEELP